MSVKTHLPWRIEFARQLLMGETPDALYETLEANADLLSPLASPLLPKGEANAKGEDRTGLAIQTKPTSVGFKFLTSAQADESLCSCDF